MKTQDGGNKTDLSCPGAMIFFFEPLCVIARIVIGFLPLTVNHNATGKSLLAKRSFQHEWTPNYIRHFMPPNHTVHNLLPPKKSNNPHQQPLYIINLSHGWLGFVKLFPLSPSSNSQMKKNNIRPFNPKVAARPEVQREILPETRRLGAFWDPLWRSLKGRHAIHVSKYGA